MSDFPSLDGHAESKRTPMRRLWDLCLNAMSVALGLAPGDSRTVTALVRELGVAPRHVWLVRRWLRAMEQERLVELSGDGFRVIGEPPPVCENLDTIGKELHFVPGVADFLRSAIGHLRALLRDDLLVQHLLPEHLRGGLSGCGGVFADELDDAVALLVGQAARGHQGTVRVLELGGGAGRTTSMVLAELAAQDFSYRFTDLSMSAVTAARELGITASVLDFERDPRDQGFPPGAADVVIACDSLHHATDLRVVIGHVRDLLVAGGSLLAVVRTGDDIAGLVSEHFAYSPPPGGAVRRDGDVFPALETWRKHLEELGFAVDLVMSAGDRSCATAGWSMVEARKSMS